MDGWRKACLIIWSIAYLSCVAAGALVMSNGLYGKPSNPYWHTTRVVVDYVGETGHFSESFMPFFGLSIVLLVLITLIMIACVAALRSVSGAIMMGLCLCASALWWFVQFFI